MEYHVLYLEGMDIGCEHTLDNAYLAHPDLRGAIVHSDRGRQYTSETYRQALSKYGIIQSMNSDGGRCHDNARCESMWARMKSELLYDRYNTESLTTDELTSSYLEIFHQLLEQQEDLLCQRWASSYD